LGAEVTIRVPPNVERVGLFGPAERNLKMIRETLGVNIAAREDVVRVRGESSAVDAAHRVLTRLFEAGTHRRTLSRQDVLSIISEEGSASWLADGDGGEGDGGVSVAGRRGQTTGWHESLDVYVGGRRVEPRSVNQEIYLDAMRQHDLVFASGPAGTGKTYLAVAAAIHLLKTGRVKKAILARPAVEAGEKLGFLPGDLQAKVNPYLRPLLDALHDMMDYQTIKRFIAADVVEVVPLAYMRGRTLNDAVIILDEAQNTTRGQMQMFLTRMGQRSKMIVTGDPTQIDLPDARESGLIDAIRRLRRTAGVGLVALDKGDVVRHELVQRIIEAYADQDSRGERADG
jgi:phosphate starvation-inducible PhoH-like protein